MTQFIDTSAARQLDRLPPFDLSCEQCAIASAIIDKGELGKMRTLIGREDFYQADHQILWDVLCHLADRGSAIDGVLLVNELKRRNIFEEIGGAAYVAQLLDTVPCAAHATFYAGKIKEAAVRRNIIATCNDALREVYSPAQDEGRAVQIALEASAKLIALASAGTPKRTVSIEEATMRVMERRGQERQRWIPTGLWQLDGFIGGLGLGLFTIVGGAPGMGKSQLIKQLCRNMASRQPAVRCGIVTVEENAEKIAENAISSITKIDNHKIAFDQLSEHEWDQVYDAAPDVARMPIFIEDASFSLPEIEASIHRLVGEHKCKVVAVDHLHLIDVDKQSSREQEVGKISKALKRIFRQLNVAGVVAAQLNRSKSGDRPNLESLRDSGSLGADADTAIMLYREDYVARQRGETSNTNILECIVAKNKNGRAGIAKQRFLEQFQTIDDWPTNLPQSPNYDPFGTEAA